MKRFALMVVCLLALATPSFAINGVGDVSAYADDQGNSCEIAAPGGNLNIYLVHKFLPGESANGSRFKVVLPPGLTFFVYVQNPSHVGLGTLLQDQSLAYTACQTTTTSLGYAFVSAAGVAPCSYVTVTTADLQTAPLAGICEGGETFMGVGQAILNADASCICNVATQPSTWGRVKALYR